MKAKGAQENTTAVMKPSSASISLAARLILEGEVVAFPTETVYGLGANALDAKAVEKIFSLKGRPADNPLIVHICSLRMLQKIAHTSPKSLLLAKKCWPGPLTIIFEKKSAIPSIVSGGLGTVAVRMPAEKTALALIRRAGVPIAAPSANVSGRPSPTSAAHVLEDFGEKVQLILDGGRAKIGVESTVVSLAGTPLVLRLGGFPFEKLQKLLAGVKIARGVHGEQSPALSPGTKYRHYAPSVPVIIVKEKDFRTFASGLKPGESRALFFGPNFPKEIVAQLAGQFQYFLHFRDGQDAAHRLFEALRDSEKKYGRIYFCEIEEKGAGRAVMERVRRAAENAQQQ